MDPRQRVYEIVKEKLEEQITTISDLDTKISILAGANGLFLSLVFGLQKIPSGLPFWIFWAGTISLGSALWLVLLAYKPQTWNSPPDPGKMPEFIEAESTDQEILKVVTENIVKYYSENRELIKKKSDRLTRSFIFTLLGLILIGLSRFVDSIDATSPLLTYIALVYEKTALFFRSVLNNGIR